MQDIQLNKDKVSVTLRQSLLKKFQEGIQEEMADLNCHYFTHQLIQDYRGKGYTVSSFHSHPEWQAEYWQDHWDADPLEQDVHKIAEEEGFVIYSWDFVDAASNVMQRRKALCNLADGVCFTFKREDGLLENFSFGWRKSNDNQMGLDKLLKLSGLTSQFRDDHWELFTQSDQQSLNA